MIAGSFGNNGELLFEIQLVANNDESFTVEALLDTGFTDGWLAINTQGSIGVAINSSTD
ncbi:hypothetical protein [Nostoc sp. FACHB-110]|uniref:hypothetical protein n=1 Tax=Nostoc sp. FACHB-110 TaxID=2692834 RepID=UPI001F54EC9B|nr:hypothetical protein [Nostoc sp. FACHB-110]